ncbi:MAG: ribosome-associated translation inhibitor RaiA [Bacteriovoracaceae bacterium]|nr:ribosome-associated translation inhibitor RaiA [Bacteriovoracaceae bacterium]
MKVTITFKHLKHTPALDARIQEKSAKLKKYFEGSIQIKWICYVKEGAHYADINVSGIHARYHASAYSDNLYKALDLALDKIEKQIGKKKSKQKEHIHHKHDVVPQFSFLEEEAYQEQREIA